MSAEQVPIRDADDAQLMKISREGLLSLSLEEMRLIQNHFRKLDRDPWDVELETFAQTWSEHCVHKTFSGYINTEEGAIDNLLKETVARVTKELDPDWCFSVFVDNAGIVDFEGDTAVAFKVETHNHPSALEPFGGAATGVGGVIRDILGVWAEPIANTNVLCFGPLDMPYDKVPKGTKHPNFIYKYVVAGIGTYGNNMGIPTVNGAIYFDESYTTNPLVYCGTAGIVPKSKYVKEAKPGHILLLVGGKTGRDGIHGVTFASAELHEESDVEAGSAVQIGDPIQEEKIKRGILHVRDAGLGSAITDLGGGGLSSAIGEQAEAASCGARVDLAKVPLKYPKMEPWEIWTSESQERMLVIVPSENLQKAVDIFADEAVEASPVGELTEEKTLHLMYNGETVAEMDMDFLFEGCPRVTREAKWTPPSNPEPDFPCPDDLTPDLMNILSSPNVASKESVIRTYDHEVKAMTVLKPLQGMDGPGDAAVMRPLYDSWKGIALSNGFNPEYGKIDSYWMAASAIDEAVRNSVAVGGRRIAVLDNFCWGNPEKPDNLAGLVRASKACYDVGIVYGTPFISGKDSLYNESAQGPVTPTLLISALGIVPDVRKAVSMELKEVGSALYVLGMTREEMGGSHYWKTRGFLGNSVPKVYPEEAKRLFDALTSAMDASLVRSCHDLSEGGLAVAMAEMAFAGGIGAEIDLNRVPTDGSLRDDHILFSESNSRFLVEVTKDNTQAFEYTMSGTVFARIGTIGGDSLTVRSTGDREVISAKLNALKEAWQGALR